MQKDLWLSPTDLETADLCLRKLALIKFMGMPKPQFAFTALGTALHGVVERYLRADELGRDKATGKSVELYPKDWFIVVERDGQSYTLSAAEQILVRKLVDKAIDEGHLIREEGRELEIKWKFPALHRSGVVFNGKMDVYLPAGVNDHKTVKTMRYALSKNGLKSSIQMNLYGTYHAWKRQKDSLPKLDTLSLKHIVYCKDPSNLKVRTTEAIVPTGDIEKFYMREIAPLTEKIIEVRGAKLWHEIPDPAKKEHACNAYGGCQFRNICAGRISQEDYAENHQRLLNDQATIPTLTPSLSTPTGNIDTMGALDKVQATAAKGKAPAATNANNPINQPVATGTAAPKAPPAAPVSSPAAAPGAKAGLGALARRAALSGAAATTTAAAPPKAPAQPKAPAPAAPVVPETPAAEAPPWAFPACGACSTSGHPGWNSKGAPCRICDAMGEKNHTLQSHMFVIVGAGNEAIWELKEEFAELVPEDAQTEGQNEVPGTGGEVASEMRLLDVSSQAETGEDENVDENPSEFEQEAANQDEVQTDETDSAAQVLANVDTKGKRGRPATGLFIFIGCAPTSGFEKRKLVPFDRIFSKYANLMVVGYNESSGEKAVESYWHMKPFERADMLVSKMPEIANELGSCYIIVSPSMLASHDAKQFLSALRTHATSVIEPLGLPS